MKTKIIYTILFAVCALFCRAFGAGNAEPIWDTTICVGKGQVIDMTECKKQIQERLERKEKQIWGELCGTVEVSVPSNVQAMVQVGDKTQVLSWSDTFSVSQNTELTIPITYTRKLVCSKIPTEEKPGMSEDSLAMWYFFGKLLSETETGKARKVSDTAFVKTKHQAAFVYKFGLSLPDTAVTPFKIQGETCFNNGKVELSMDSAYLPYGLDWIALNTNGVVPFEAQNTPVKFYSIPDDGYLYPIVCTATACKGETRSDTIFIGKLTPAPVMEDLACVAANATSFDVKIKKPDSRLSYHWSVEDLTRGVVVDTQQGTSVIMKIPLNDSVKLKLVSAGGCKASDTVAQVLHRSVVADGRNIYLQGDADCLFKGDTLRLLLQNAPHEDLVWKSGREYDTLPWNKDFVIQGKDSVYRMSVFSKFCPDIVDSVTFNIREDFKVSLGSSPMCVSVRDSNVIRLISNGINPEVHWYGNGVVIDSTTYSKQDSILLRLTNPGDPNLYVKVKAKECGRRDSATLQLRPLPEKPSWDTSWNACIPLGIADTIELRVQPQEGVEFKWYPEEEAGKFWQIGQSDSNSTLVVANYKLENRGKSISVSVSASVVGCGDSEPITKVLYATGAGLGEEWHIDSKLSGSATMARRMVGFCQNSPDEIQKEREELDPFAFFWTSSLKINGSNSLQILQFVRPSLPFDVACVLTNKNTSCYSYYSQTIEEVSTLQNIATSSSTGIAQNGTGNENVQGMSYAAPPQEENHRGGFLLAPNPTHGNTLLYMERAMVDKRAVIEILTEQGVCLYRQKADADVAELPTASFRSGLYFVRVRVGDEDIIVKKLIVQ
ncbi:MAG: T9SS type A sorting domain-containing protein [Bacteroides sp.]|nr:T9SS type A sorting domain-containing protein [Ruminococcus flavefaciens]MCM1554838.1 T9SS type A sorting domain-containing protein [Bacteroides sp.]